jgi:hypothetical protein
MFKTKTCGFLLVNSRQDPIHSAFFKGVPELISARGGCLSLVDDAFMGSGSLEAEFC